MASSARAKTKVRSILSSWTGISFSFDSDDQPVPKSSTDRRTPNRPRASRVEESNRRVLGEGRLGDLEGQAPGGYPVGLQGLADAGHEVGLAQHPRGQVDGHGQVEALGPPGRALTQGGSQDPRGQVPDQARALGQGDELVGGEQAPRGVLPPDQGFDGVHQPGAQLDLGLVVHDQVAPVDGLAEVGGHLHAVAPLLVVPTAVDGVAAALALGPVHGHVGPLEHGEGIVAGRAVGDADAHPDLEGDVAEAHGLPDQVAQVLGDGGGVAEGRQPGHEDGELVAAEAGDHVVGPGHPVEAVPDLDQQLVAHVVAEPVVDVLEAVEVHEEEGGVAVVLLGAVPGQRVGHEVAVRQAGERVPSGLALQLVLRRHLLGDVPQVADDAGHGRLVEQVGGDGVDVDPAAVEAADADPLPLLVPRFGQHPGEAVDGPLEVLGVDEVGEVAPVVLVVRVAEQLPDGGDLLVHPALAVEDDGHVRGVADQGLPLLLAGLQQLVLGQALADVPDEGMDPEGVPLAGGPCRDLDRDLGAVGPEVADVDAFVPDRRVR